MTGEPALGYTGVTATEIRNNDEGSRYELTIDDEIVAIADYRVEGDVVALPHTETVPARQGQGHAARIVRFALDDVRATGRQVRPECWFVAAFIAEHPEYADLTV